MFGTYFISLQIWQKNNIKLSHCNMLFKKIKTNKNKPKTLKKSPQTPIWVTLKLVPLIKTFSLYNFYLVCFMKTDPLSWFPFSENQTKWGPLTHLFPQDEFFVCFFKLCSQHMTKQKNLLPSQITTIHFDSCFFTLMIWVVCMAQCCLLVFLLFFFPLFFFFLFVVKAWPHS